MQWKVVNLSSQFSPFSCNLLAISPPTLDTLVLAPPLIWRSLGVVYSHSKVEVRIGTSKPYGFVLEKCHSSQWKLMSVPVCSTGWIVVWLVCPSYPEHVLSTLAIVYLLSIGWSNWLIFVFFLNTMVIILLLVLGRSWLWTVDWTMDWTQ